MRKPRRRTVEEQNPATVYDGLRRLGEVLPDGERWSAVTPDGLVLGVFASKRDAARAVAEAPR